MVFGSLVTMDGKKLVKYMRTVDDVIDVLINIHSNNLLPSWWNIM